MLATESRPHRGRSHNPHTRKKVRQDNLIGKLISHYRIVRKIGEGGSGEVFLAEDTVLSRQVAMKFLSAPAHSEARQQMLAEARSAASIDHPYTCKVFEAGEWEGRPFIVMEYVEGETLAERLKSNRLDIDETLRIASEISEALADAHDRSIVHCDLKPSNVMIARSGHVKLMDFGLARLVRASKDNSDVTQEITWTATSVIGTPAYMPPEQARGDNLNPRADIFTFGIVLYEMLCGIHPFRRQTPETTIAAILHEEPPQIDETIQPVPKPLVRILQRALAKDPSDRFPSARELWADLVRLRKEALNGLEAKEPASNQPAIAILPFKDFSPEHNHEYLCHGLAEELIIALGKLEHLRVSSRTATYRYKDTDADLQEIGRQLNVTWILEGSVQRSGERLRVVVKLVDLKSGCPAWSEKYDQTIEDIFEIQDMIARSVVEKLRITFPVPDPIQLLPPVLQNVRAYEAYLKGRFFWNKRTEENLKVSIEHFQRALAEDSCHALAHAGLADAYVTLSLYGAMPPLDVMPLAKQAADRALELHNYLPEALTPRACCRAIFDWDWHASAKEFETVIQMNPRHAQARQWYAMNCLCPVGDFERAAIELNQAAELEPVSLPISTSIGILHFFQRDYDKAISHLQSVLQMDERFYLARYFLAQAYTEKRMFHEALRELERTEKTNRRTAETIAARGYTAARAGHRAAAEDALNALLRRSVQRYVSPVLIAQVQATMKDYDSAISSLQEALRLRSTELIWLNLLPAFDVVRSDPRFAEYRFSYSQE